MSDKNGLPLAPVAQRLVTANGSYASDEHNELEENVASPLDEVTTCIHYVEQQAFAKPLMPITVKPMPSDTFANGRKMGIYGYYAPKITPPSALKSKSRPACRLQTRCLSIRDEK